MTGPLDPTQLSREQWQGVLQQALADLRANHNDAEALQAIKDANASLNAYDEAEAAGGWDRIESGVGGGVGALADRTLDPFRAVIGLGKGVYNLATEPSPTVDQVDQAIQGKLASIGHTITHPGEAYQHLQEESPSDVAGHVVSAGELLLPFGKTGGGSFSAAGSASRIGRGIEGALGYKAPPLTGPSVGELATSGLTAPFRYVRDIARHRGLANEALKLGNAQKAAELARGPTQDALLRQQLGTATAGRQMAEGAAAHQPVDLGRKLELLEARIRQMPATQESIELGNEIKRLRIEAMQAGDEAGGNPFGGPGEPPPPPAPAPKTPPLSPFSGPGTATAVEGGGQVGIPTAETGVRAGQPYGLEGVGPDLNALKGKPIGGTPYETAMNELDRAYSKTGARAVGPANPAELDDIHNALFNSEITPEQLAEMPGVTSFTLKKYIDQLARSLAQGRGK